MTRPGIPNEFSLSTSCFGSRLTTIEDQVFAAVAMGFRSVELGLTDTPPTMEGLEDSRRETGAEISSMVAGCLDPLNGGVAALRLASTNQEERERALNSVRRHIRLSRSWNCDTLIVRGSRVEDPEIQRMKCEIEERLVREERTPELKEEIAAFVHKVQKKGQKQVEHLCRSLHTLMAEAPEVRFAIEPGMFMDDLLGFDAMGWTLDDLESKGLCYWHDVGSIHLRESAGLPPQGAWLDAFGSRLIGAHLQDAANDEVEMPLGLGEVDFKLVAEYLPRDALKVVELNPRHGRAELLASIQFMLDHGF
jgi:sugar phosphate isomerase/epimerase